MTNRGRSSRRPTAPKPVRHVARAANLGPEELANAIMDGQPEPPTSPEAEGVLDRLIETERDAHPDIDDDALVSLVNERVQELVSAGNPYVSPLAELLLGNFLANRGRVQIALMGTRWHPTPPVMPKQQRIDAIASTVLALTGWPSVADDTVQAVYRWLFGDEALFLIGTEMRVEAGRRMLESRDLRPVRVPYPDTGELVLVTREEIIEHADADGRVLEAALRYEERQARSHGRLIAALRPYGDRTTSVDDAMRRAAADLGIEADGRGFHQLASLVVVAAEARASTLAAEPFTIGGTLRVTE